MDLALGQANRDGKRLGIRLSEGDVAENGVNFPYSIDFINLNVSLFEQATRKR